MLLITGALFCLASLPAAAESSLPGLNSSTAVERSAAEDFFTHYDMKAEPEVLRRVQFRDGREISILRLTNGLYAMRFTSLYIESEADGRTSSLLLFTGGETRSQLVSMELKNSSILDNGDLWVDLLADDTRGFQDAPDYTEYTTRTLYGYIIGFDGEGRLCCRAADIPVMQQELISGIPSGPKKQIDVIVRESGSVLIKKRTEELTEEQNALTGSYSLY